MGFRLKDMISIQLLKSIFGVYLLLALLITSIQLFLEFEATKNDIKKEMESLTKTFTPALRSAIFDLDEKMIETILMGIKENTIIVGVTLHDEKNHKLMKIGSVVPQNKSTFLTKQFFTSLILNHGEDKSLLATIDLFSDHMTILNRLKYGVTLIIINSIFKTIILWILMIYFLRKYLSKPLVTLSNKIKLINKDSLEPFPFKYPFNNELKTLHRNFNQLLLNLIKSQTKIKDYQQNLENKVKKRTKDLNLAKNEAIKANKIKSQFLENMSHELKTPLNAIIGFSSLLKEDLSGEKNKSKRDQIKKIATAGDHLLLVISDILDLAKIEKGKIEIHPTIIDLEKFYEEIASYLKQLAIKNENKIQLSKDFPPHFKLKTDEMRLRQCLLNLISNSCKFTEKGCICFDITLSKEPSPHLLITVKDSGVGMTEEQVKSIFSRFYQADPSNTKKFEGTGLGMTITKELTELMGGKIEVKAKEGFGTTVMIYLPV